MYDIQYGVCTKQQQSPMHALRLCAVLVFTVPLRLNDTVDERNVVVLDSALSRAQLKEKASIRHKMSLWHIVETEHPDTG